MHDDRSSWQTAILSHVRLKFILSVHRNSSQSGTANFKYPFSSLHSVCVLFFLLVLCQNSSLAAALSASPLHHRNSHILSPHLPVLPSLNHLDQPLLSALQVNVQEPTDDNSQQPTRENPVPSENSVDESTGAKHAPSNPQQPSAEKPEQSPAINSKDTAEGTVQGASSSESQSTHGSNTITTVQPLSSSIVATHRPTEAAAGAGGGLRGSASSTLKAIDDDDDDLYLDMEGNDREYWSGEQFEYEQAMKRKRAREKKWIADGLANQLGPNATMVRPQQSEHPTKGNLHPLLWKFQFGSIIFALGAMYALQVFIDFQQRKTFSLHSRPSTCLMLGANFRGLGETKLVSLARFFTCAFLHAHIFHLFLNTLSIYASWIYFSVGPGAKVENIWVYHWTFPIFMLTAFFGSFYSYQTTLKYSGFSIGASGGCLGLSAAFLLLGVRFEGVPEHRRFQFILTVASIVASCVPWDSLFSGESGSTDLGAHAAGALGGVIIALALSDIPSRTSMDKLVDWGDICSGILLALLLLAYAEVAREHFVDGRELLVRAYVKWLGMTTTGPEDGRRLTSPGRLQCELITEEYLYLLDAEKVEDDPETIIKRLEEENKNRRKTAPDLGGVVY